MDIESDIELREQALWSQRQLVKTTTRSTNLRIGTDRDCKAGVELQITRTIGRLILVNSVLLQGKFPCVNDDNMKYFKLTKKMK